MSSYRYHSKFNAYAKQCSCCKEYTVGTENEQASLVIFKEEFAESNGSSQTADNLQSRCRICNSWKRRNLGISLQQLREMYQHQDGCCVICDIPISLDLGSPNPANVDHDHATGITRELLCGNCNRGLGLFFDNTEFLIKAAEYLKAHQEKSDG